MHIVTDTLVNTHSPFPPTITYYNVVDSNGFVVFRTTDESKCTTYLSIQTRAELRDKQ